MREININGKDYPFVISAANAKRNAQQVVKGEQPTVEEMIDQYTDLLHEGLKDGLLTRPIWGRWWHRLLLPSRNTLQRLIPFEQMATLINGEAYPEAPKEGQTEEGKKH